MKATNTDAGTGIQTVAPRKFFYTQKEAAKALGLSEKQFFNLKQSHPLYAPNGSKSLKPDPVRGSPLWSEELIKLIAFARSCSVQGLRQLTDDEGLKVRQGMEDSRRRRYLSYIDS